MVKLRPMRDKEYQRFIKYSAKDYAEQQQNNKKWSSQEVQNWLENDSFSFLTQGQETPGHVFLRILNIQEIPIGYLWIIIKGNTAHVKDIMIEKNHRRRGYARSAMKNLISWCQDQGITAITLHLFPDNTKAHDLYIRCGFSPSNDDPEIWIKQLL